MPPEDTTTTSAPGLPAREALYTAEDIAMMSPAEQDHAKRVNAEHIAGGDPFGELTEAQAAEAAAAALALGQQPPAEAPAPAATPAAAPAAAAPAEAPAEAPAPAAATPTPAPQPTLQPVGDAAKFTERRTAIANEVADIEQRWADGEIDTAEMRRLKAPLAEESDNLLMQLTSHQTLAMAQQQMAAAQFQQQIGALKASAREQGLDYDTDPRLAKQFNQALDVLEADPEMATKSPAELIAEAHAIVVARNPGQRAATPSPAPAPAPAAGAPAAPAPAPAAARMQPPPPPTTLRTMTSAERPMDGAEGLGQRFTGTNAIEREKLWDQMSPAQRKAMLDD